MHELRKEITKATESLNQLCEWLEIAKAEKDTKEIERLTLDVAKKMYYREGLIKALRIVSKES